MNHHAKKNIPMLRFPGFDGEWEENVLGKLATFSKGKGISKADIEDDGSLECITYGELYTRYSELIDEVRSKTNLDPRTLVLSSPNDVIIPASGETHLDIATASCVLRGGIALGGDLNIIKSETKGVFLAYYLNNARKKDIASLAQGSSVIHLYSTQLKSLKLFLPLPEEQQKIATFLTTIDTRIQQLTQKVALLEQYKKGMMQQIFSQEIRFKDEEGRDFPAWEEKEFGSVFNLFPTNSLSRSQLNHEKGTVMNIHYGDIHTKFKTLFDIKKEEVPFINDTIELVKITEESYCKVGDLVIADASEDYKDIGKAIEIINLNGQKLLAGLHTIGAKFK